MTDQRGPTAGDPSVARSPQTAAVVTPEAVLLEFRAAGIASRLLAKGLDLIIQLILLYTQIFASVVVAGFANETLGLILSLLTVFFVVFGYPMMEAFWNGYTIGKRAFNIRVITVEGGPVRVRHAAIRSLIWPAEFAIPPGGLFALTSALLTRDSQRLGDLAAGTVVVRSNTQHPSPIFFAPAHGAEAFSLAFDAGRISPPQYALVREFLTRAHDLTPEARAQVAQRMASGLEASSDRPRPPAVRAEQYLVAAVYAYQKRFTPAGGAVAGPPRR